MRRSGLVGRDDRIVAAVSGGGDSVALLYLLAEAGAALGATLAGVVHVHHGLRGAAADADEACARDHAVATGVPIVVERADVARLARERGHSIESEGRELREAAFARARETLGATLVATGHTMDDQAETVLLRLARGAGVSALSGIRARRGHLIRPLLAFRRQELRDYLSERGLAWREDASNADLSVTRNRVRHRVLPLLAAELSPRVVEALARVAVLAAGEDAALDALTASAAATTRRVTGGAGRIDVAALLAQPLAVRRRLVRAWLSEAGARSAGFAHVEAVLALATTARRAARLSLPGSEVTLRDGWLAVAPGRRPASREGGSRISPPVVCHLPVPGVLCLEGLGTQVSADLRAVDASRALALAREPAGPDVAVVDADVVGEVLAVRFRRPGDRIQPLGMAGRRKLQDVFVDRKVPRPQRDRVPLVVDAHDRIVWVAGHAIAAGARVTSSTTRVLLLQVQRSGGVV